MDPRKIKRLWGLPAALLLIAADQLTKYLAVIRLKEQAAVPLIRGVLELSYVENRGMAFGLLQNGRWVFLVLTVLAVAAFIFLFIRIPAEKRFRPLTVGLVFLTAGAVGNLIDRIRLGYVIDFIYIKLINFPVFNVADCYVTWTGVILAILLLFHYREEDYKRLGL